MKSKNAKNKLDNTKRIRNVRMTTSKSISRLNGKTKNILKIKKNTKQKQVTADFIFRMEEGLEDFKFYLIRTNDKRYTRDEFTYSLLTFQEKIRSILRLNDELNQKFLDTNFKREERVIRKYQCKLAIAIFVFYITEYGKLVLTYLPLLKEEIMKKRFEFLKEIEIGTFKGFLQEKELLNILNNLI